MGVPIHQDGTNSSGSLYPVTDDLAYMRTAIANVYFFGPPRAWDRGWVLIDGGVYGYAGRIREAAEQRFGPGARPSAIILTHGHFDHVGTIRVLADQWKTPVYAHELELPYLTGQSSYPPPDPSVGGGAMAAMSSLYPRGPFDLGPLVQPLPSDGSVPGMPDWRWFHTPGHSPGHVSLFRDADKTLIAGDAFVTTDQESALAVLRQRPEVHRPPAYFTPDWQSASASVQVLASLEPEIAATGHGLPMQGSEMRRALHELAERFDEIAVPENGRYVEQPAVAGPQGVVSVPPPVSDPLRAIIFGTLTAFILGLVISIFTRSSRRRSG